MVLASNLWQTRGEFRERFARVSLVFFSFFPFGPPRLVHPERVVL